MAEHVRCIRNGTPNAPFTATGTAYTGKADLVGVTIVAAGATATVTIRDGGAGGDDLLSLSAPTLTTYQWTLAANRKLTFSTDIHLTIGGAGAKVYLYFT